MEIFLAAPLYIQLHATAATLALIIGPYALYRKRRDIWHKTVGYVWIIAMLTVAISSFWISSFGVIGPFSPLHLFAILTLITITRAIYFARIGNIAAHKANLHGLYWGGLWVAFSFNFLANRMSNRILLGREEASGFVIFGILLIAATFLFFPRLKRLQKRWSAARVFQQKGLHKA